MGLQALLPMPKIKLTDDQVEAIRWTYKRGGVSLRMLARAYHVSATQIWRLVGELQRKGSLRSPFVPPKS